MSWVLVEMSATDKIKFKDGVFSSPEKVKAKLQNKHGMSSQVKEKKNGLQSQSRFFSLLQNLLPFAFTFLLPLLLFWFDDGHFIWKKGEKNERSKLSKRRSKVRKWTGESKSFPFSNPNPNKPAGSLPAWSTRPILILLLPLPLLWFLLLLLVWCDGNNIFARVDLPDGLFSFFGWNGLDWTWLWLWMNG